MAQRMAIACLLVLGWARAAWAQPEMHGFVEPCTIGNYQEMNTECELCPVSGRDLEACRKRFGKQGYEKKCRTRGDAAAWEELWCVRKLPGESREANPNTKLVLAAALSFTLIGLFVVLKRSRAS